MPQIEMTPTVKFVLIGLRVYLLVMLALIALKFSKTFLKAEQRPKASPAAAQAELSSPGSPQRQDTEPEKKIQN